jgi:hypothetical protein
MKSSLIRLSGCLTTAFSLTVGAQAAIVLTINVQDPSHVTFTAVASNSAITRDLATDFSGGISLLGFFTVNQTILSAAPLAISGNWKGRNATLAYNETVTYDYSAQTGDVVAGKDLSIYNSGGGGTQSFVTSAPPFTGISSANMTAFASGLPLAGSSGSLISGFQSTQGGVIGQWSVVPEPAETTVAVGALIGAFALVRRSRKSISK